MVNAIAPKAPIGASPHDDADDAEKACETMSMRASTGLPRSPSMCRREGEQDREEQHLQDLAFGEGADHRVGDDVHQELDGALLPALVV